MHIEYNHIKLKMVELTECHREAVYDDSGTDLLYIKWTIGCVATLSSGGYPGGTQVDFTNAAAKNRVLLNNPELLGSAPRPKPVLGSDPSAFDVTEADENASVGSIFNSAFITDKELHWRLMQPRKPLKLSAYNPDGTEYVWLESPRPFAREVEVAAGQPTADIEASRNGFNPRPATDSANGPIPLRADVVQPSGEMGTFGVHFVIETCVAPTGSDSERLVLSHRWQTSHQQNHDHYLTRVITGEVHFSGAILGLTGTSPDWFRSQFFHPIPLGFRREVPAVELSKDGLCLRYELHDTDPTITFDPGDSGATEMEIVETHNYLTRNVYAANIMDWARNLFIPSAPNKPAR